MQQACQLHRLHKLSVVRAGTGRRVALTRRVAQCALPAFVNAELAKDIGDEDAQRMMASLRRVEVTLLDTTLGNNGKLMTAVVGPTAEELAAYPADAPVAILLHSFDSSCLELRRVHPLLSRGMPTYAVDLVGWGFTDHSWLQGDKGHYRIGPENKRAHLRAFIEQYVPRDRKVLLLGTSVGGAIAMDFALEHPQLVDKLVLVDPQVFIDGIGPLAKLPRFAAELGVKILQQYWLRNQANVASYYDKEKFATADATKVGRIHTVNPGWMEANLAFMCSGGYSMSKRIKDVKVDTMVLWGRNDEILNTQWADRFPTELPSCKLVFVDKCGHVPHLEHADVVAENVLRFAGVEEQVGAPVVQTVAA